MTGAVDVAERGAGYDRGMVEAAWDDLGGLVFAARRLVEGLYAGGHASPRHGSGQEFHDYRAFVPGDDVRDVDWKLWGRSDRLYLRRHQMMTDLRATVVVDTTASMNFAGLDGRGRALTGSAQPTKLKHAVTLAAAIAMLAVRQGDRVGVAVVTDRVERHVPAAGGWGHLRTVIAELSRVRPALGRGDLGAALRQVHPLVGRRGLVIVVSDVLDDPTGDVGLFDALDRLRHAHCDVTVLQVLTPVELDLRRGGDRRLLLVDSETRRQVGTSLAEVAGAYGRLMAEHVALVRRGCLARGADHELMVTDVPPVAGLRAYLARRGG